MKYKVCFKRYKVFCNRPKYIFKCVCVQVRCDPWWGHVESKNSCLPFHADTLSNVFPMFCFISTFSRLFLGFLVRLLGQTNMKNENVKDVKLLSLQAFSLTVMRSCPVSCCHSCSWWIRRGSGDDGQRQRVFPQCCDGQYSFCNW